MKLNSVRIEGFRRFEDATVYLDRPVIAVVGPNEAGKTSLLEALLTLETSDAVKREDLTRGLNASVEYPIVTARYALSPEEAKLVEEVGGEGDARWYVLRKFPEGDVRRELEPPVTRPDFLPPRIRAARAIGELLEDEALVPVISRPLNTDSSDQAEKLPLRARLASVAQVLESESEILPGQGIGKIEHLLAGIEASSPEGAADTDVARGKLEEIDRVISEVHALETADHPQEIMVSLLEQQRPRFSFFSLEDRTLKAEYSTNVLAQPPPALRNLFDLAGVDSTDVRAALETGEHGRRASLQERANARLLEACQRAWNQSNFYVRLQIDESEIRVHANTAASYRPIVEGSDGLRTFVALLAFTHQQIAAPDRPGPILLVDEAETHLHYDAQADLVDLFYRQQEAPQVIYTTHSAGCLPRDLGTDIRVAEAVKGPEGEATDRSDLRSDFWRRGAGFSPLMMAMGASVFALSPARFAVLAEGISETILLPTLLREATGATQLQYQVAPGLAGVSRQDAKLLNREAPRVAYMVDGDKAGDEIVKKLCKAGVDNREISRLPKGRVLEDLLKPSAYAKAVNRQLRLSGHAVSVPAKSLRTCPRTKSLDAWCSAEAVDVPSKTRVAQELVGLSTEGEQLLSARGRRFLQELSRDLSMILGLEPSDATAPG